MTRMNLSGEVESADSLVTEITDEFLSRVERGESPDINEYVAAYPHLADLLRRILPALQMMKGSGFDQSPVSMPKDSIPPLSGTLGDYRLIREIGRGGMGVVYEAEQISLQRRVALKTLSFAAALNSTRLERFKYEAQAAARLHHSNIVPVYSVGCERGVWYYAMQIIEGETLADAIAELRQVNRLERKTPSEALTEHLDHLTRDASPKEQAERDSPAWLPVPGALPLDPSADPDGERKSPSTDKAARNTAQFISTASTHRDRGYINLAVDIGIQAADALQHAHDLDIVHRDIKPANLMIDTRGHMWVADFGLARCRDDARLTATGDMIGTLAYMSPEQVSGNRGIIDHRTDIYSLGATLYELLTLRPAYEDSSRAALIYRISTDDPTPIRKHNPSVPADLETIIQKAMSREPHARYQSASEMADDLRRFRDSRPILARRPSMLERLSKWSRRHRSAVTVAVAGSILLTAAMVVSTIMIARAHALTAAALEKTKAALMAEAKQRIMAEVHVELAQRNFDKARAVLGSFMTIAEDEMSGSEELQATRSEMLQLCLNYYQDFIDTAHNDKPLQAELVASHQRIAKILHTIGSTQASREALEQALQTQERLVEGSPNDETLRRSLFTMYMQLGAFDGAGPIYMLRNESIQKELKMTPEQTAAAEKISDDFRETFHHSSGHDHTHPMDLTSSRQHFRSGTVEALEQITSLLDSDQMIRLRQIDMQRRGTNAWNSPDVADELCLSALQRIHIKEIGDQLWRLFRTRNDEDIRDRVKDLQKQLDAVLSEDQSQIWQRMTGEPFRGQIYLWRGKSRSDQKKSPESNES